MNEAQQGQTDRHSSATPCIPKPWHKAHPEQERFDSVTIEKVERWKESHLSGDEWRFTTIARFFVKGVEVYSRPFRDIETAIACLPAVLNGSLIPDNSEVWENREKALAGKCDQPGCCEDAVYIHSLKHQFTDGIKHDVASGGQYRKFCERHKHRGDCALEDADRNYDVQRIDPVGPKQ